jgi:opacity protein-like surface antigen
MLGLAVRGAAAEPAAAVVPSLKTEARTVSVSLSGSSDRYGESSSQELRSGLELECGSELKLGRSALDWSFEFYYDYSRNRSDGAVTNANSVGVDLARIMLSRWRGNELKLLKPYVLAGAEMTWLREPDDEGKKATSRFISPAVGLGAELKLTRYASLNAEYRQNMAGGDRRISGVTLGLTYALFGGDDEDEEAAAKTETPASK